MSPGQLDRLVFTRSWHGCSVAAAVNSTLLDAEFTALEPLGLELAQHNCNPMQQHHSSHCLHFVYVNEYLWAGIQTWGSWEVHSSKDRAAGEKGPVTELKLGTYALSRSFSHKLLVPVEILCPWSPFSTGHSTWLVYAWIDRFINLSISYPYALQLSRNHVLLV